MHTEDFYDDHDIELLTSTTVPSIDPEDRRIELAPGGSLAYDRLLLTTGATPETGGDPRRRPRGVHYLRSLATPTPCGTPSVEPTGWS